MKHTSGPLLGCEGAVSMRAQSFESAAMGLTVVLFVVKQKVGFAVGIYGYLYSNKQLQASISKFVPQVSVIH